ncbi:MAG: Rrf2 family transcriptional regulator [Pirellulaceae bacterium]|nr:Rrf2 family transcriptional regulator [Pirellulaceae bacterium]
MKVLQQLARLGYVRTYPGRGGGIALAKDASAITVREVIEAMEGSVGVLDCFQDASFCPMEPGCHLRRLLMHAESAFYEVLGSTSIAQLYRGRRKGGLSILEIEIGGV